MNRRVVEIVEMVSHSSPAAGKEVNKHWLDQCETTRGKPEPPSRVLARFGWTGSANVADRMAAAGLRENASEGRQP